jgi:alkanesulfonate monooxygenase SsuD/methylene tetrahydromethanopterin reductase-like flavin-dependent oxidoreductase (luciferase family)
MTPTRPLAVGITPLETRRDVIVRLAGRAEELGYAAFFVAEAWGHDASVLLAEVAVNTSRIQIGTGVVNVWGRGAGSIAMLAASLDELSGGRFVLGLGAGSPQLAEGLHDVTFRAPVSRLEATTRQVRRLLDGERIIPSEPGGSRPLRLGVLPPSRVPITLAGLGPRAVRVAGQHADGWYPFLLPVSSLKAAEADLHAGAALGEPGRPLPRICPGIPVAISSDPARARATAVWWVAFYLTSMGPLYAKTLRRLGFGNAVGEVLAANPTRGGTPEIPESAGMLLDELTLWGTAANARAGLDSWYDAGADMPVVVLPPNQSAHELEDILEALRPTVPVPADSGQNRWHP